MSIFPIVVIFFRGVCLGFYHQLLSVSYISRESWVLSPLILCSLMMCVNNRVHYGPMVVFVCLLITLPHYHSYADLSEVIDFLTCLSGIFCHDCVSKIKSVLSIILYSYMGLCIFSLSIFLMMIAKIRVLYLITIIKSEVWPICHCLGLGHKTMVFVACLSMFLQ